MSRAITRKKGELDSRDRTVRIRYHPTIMQKVPRQARQAAFTY